MTEFNTRAPDGRPSTSFRITHNATGLTVTGRNGIPNKVTFSVPRQLRPDNTQLPRGPEEINQAFTNAMALVAQVATFNQYDAHFTRVDITAYIPVAPYSLIPQFVNRKHRRFHKLPKHYPNESLTWGTTGGARLVFYDKSKQQKKGADVRTRVELQLRGPRLCKLFGVPEGEKLRQFTIQQAYHVLRTLLLQFGVVAVAPKYSQDTLLAYCMSKGQLAPDGRHLLEWRNEGLQPNTARKNRERVGAITLGFTGLDWATLLPAEPTMEQVIAMT